MRWELAPAESTTFPDELAGGIAVHTASYGAPADYMREPMATFQANTAGLIRTFAEAARVGAAHVVYLSSAEVYGQPPAEAIPTREDYRGAPTWATPARSMASPSGWQRCSGCRCPAKPASRSPQSGRGISTAPASASTTVASRWR